MIKLREDDTGGFDEFFTDEPINVHIERMDKDIIHICITTSQTQENYMFNFFVPVGKRVIDVILDKEDLNE